MSDETSHTQNLIPIEFTPPLASVDWSREPQNSWTRVVKAPTAAYLLDQYIQSVTDDRHTLFDLIRSEYAQFIQTGRDADLKAGLETLTGVGVEDFWRKRIENDDFETAPIYLQPASLDLEPYQLRRIFTNEEIRDLDRDPASRSRSRSDQVLQLVITAYGESYLETCGCASNQSGGVARRTAAFNQLEALYPDVLKIDLGRAFPRHVTDELSEYETVIYFDSMNLMNYDAIIPSVYELWADRAFLLKIKDRVKFPFIAANVVDKATDRNLFDPYIIAKFGELRVGIIGLAPSASDSYRDVWAFESATHQYDLLDPIETTSKYVSELKDKCDLIVVAGDIPPLTVRRIIEATEHIDVVVTADGYANLLYPLDADRPSSGYAFTDNFGFRDNTLVVNSTMRSYGFHRLDLSLDRRDGRIKNWVLLSKELNQSVEDDAHTRDILNTFYASIEKDSAFWSSYDQRFFWALEEQAELNGKNAYAGVDNCESCHKQIVEQWRGSLHAQGLNTLIKKHKNFYPRCVTCHTTGFNYETGFKINSSELGGVQCEVCHGPGENHIKWAETSAYQRDDVVDASFLAGFFGDSEPENVDTQTHIRSVLDEKYCVECHDQDNSPRFDFVTYWEKIKH